MRNHNQIGNDLGFDKYSIMCLVSICVSFDLWIAVGGLAAFSNKMFDIQSFQTKTKRPDESNKLSDPIDQKIQRRKLFMIMQCNSSVILKNQSSQINWATTEAKRENVCQKQKRLCNGVSNGKFMFRLFWHLLMRFKKRQEFMHLG